MPDYKPLTSEQRQTLGLDKPKKGHPTYEQYLASTEAMTPGQKFVEGLFIRPLAKSMFGPQSALTERMFGPEESAGSRAANIALGVAPYAAGWGAGALVAKPAAALAGRIGAPVLGDLITGAVSGAAGSAPMAAADEEPILPAAAMGGVMGAGFGLGVWGLTKAGAKLAAAYASRPGREAFPRIAELDEVIPHIDLEVREAASRAGAARKAYRKLVPEGTDLVKMKRSNPVLFARARASAREAARTAKGTSSPLDDLDTEGLTLHNIRDAVFRVTNDSHKRKSFSALSTLWNSYVTRLSTTLMRDPKYGTQGRELANHITRIHELADHLEGRIRNNIFDPLWRNVPKAEEEIIDSVLHGTGGRVGAQGMAVVKRWRELADEAFDEMKGLKLMEEVSATHPAVTGGQQELFPEIAKEAAKAAKGWRIVPLQHRSNYVPYYRSPAGMAKLMRNGTPERKAFLQDLIDKGEASTMKEAGDLLDEIVGGERHFSPLHIRTGPFQHERELTLNLPRERNAKRWMDHWIHDYSRRAAQAFVVGGEDEAVKGLVKAMEDGGNFAGSEALNRVWQNFIGRPPRDVARMMPLARKVRAGVAVTMLSTRVGLLQVLQLSNTAARMGIRGTLEGVVAGWRNPVLREAAQETGALLPSQHLLSIEEPISQIGRWWIDNITLMPRGDRLARGLSAVSGGVMAQRWAKEFWKLAQADAAAGSPSLARTGVGAALKYAGVRNRAERMAILQRRLEETLGIPIKHVLETKGEVPINTVMAGMRNASHNTQFANTILDMPEARRTGAGQFLYMLKTFSKQQTPFVLKLASDAVKGDTGPLARYLITYPTLYAAVKPFLDFLGSRDAVDEADEETMEKVRAVLEGALWTGVFGGMGDFINQMGSSDPGKALFNYGVGPAIAQGVGTVGDVGTLVTEGDAGPLIERWTPRVLRPVVRWMENR